VSTSPTVQSIARNDQLVIALEATSPAPHPDGLEARLARLETQYAAGLEACARLIDFCIELLDDLHGRA